MLHDQPSGQANAMLDEELRAIRIVNETGSLITSKLDLATLVQSVVDIAVELTGAEFGAFFYNVLGEAGEAISLYSLSGADLNSFAHYPHPRHTAVFAPTFRGEGVVRSDDIMADPPYGKSAPYHGMPADHLPVRSYLAVPVVSRSGEVIGGLMFGHAQKGQFADWHESVVVGIANHAAVGIDNSRLYEAAKAEIERRELAEARLRETDRRLNAVLNNATVSIFLMNELHHCVYMNAAAETLTGYTLAETTGRPLHDVIHHTRPDGLPFPFKSVLSTAPSQRTQTHRAKRYSFTRTAGSTRSLSRQARCTTIRRMLSAPLSRFETSPPKRRTKKLATF